MNESIKINGAMVECPAGATAYKYSDPTEPARWIYAEEEAREIASIDPGLIIWIDTPTAEIVSGIFGDDGSVWTSQAGETLDDLCEGYGGEKSYQEHDDPDLVPGRIVFPDGSAIVYGDSGWDVEGSRPYLMRGLEA